MRIRATVAAVCGALALAAVAVPSAQADGKASPFDRAPQAKKMAAASEDIVNPEISKVVISGGSDLVFGTSGTKTVTLTVTASSPSGIQDGWAAFWHGPNLEEYDQVFAPEADHGTCTVSATNPTVSTCKVTVSIDVKRYLWNALAGGWKVYADALGTDGGYTSAEAYTTARFKRAGKVTVNAAPEPVRKGKTITVTGKLSRANWDDNLYHGYTNQSVQLQFRKKGTSTYKTVKTVKSNSTGGLKTTVQASVDGYWRYNFVGTSTTGKAVAAGDFVDVK
ncbi:calcium-binding protein [Actinacidiphila sp. bgisy160]|uniref:calcium-binding protein n=1 Tax=Actinacidiphila sp. bgisy160 TaxID=3413796 RepID=UPI003D73560F